MGEIGVSKGPAPVTTVTLADRFRTERDSYVTRASALFPVRVEKDGDTILTFLDYWRLKNTLADVRIVLRIFDEAGRLVHVHPVAVIAQHNEISLSALLHEVGAVKDERFMGLVELEVLSGQNLMYAFPAIMAFFRTGSLYSAVHSTGRVRNPTEPRVRARSTETNWTCRYGANVVPFFHLFNGPRRGGLGAVTVRLLDRFGATLAREPLTVDLEAPFASRLVCLDEVFDLDALGLRNVDFFAAIDVPDEDVFPRLVVGNLHRESGFMESTHSFYWSRVGDDLLHREPGAPDILSFIAAPNIPELDLELTFFPTNLAYEVETGLRHAPHGGSLGPVTDTVRFRAGGEGGELWRYRAPADAGMTCFEMRKGPLPARLNSAFRYSVRGAGGRYSTDIAMGAHAHVYPPKRFHWGHGVISNDIETVTMVRNLSFWDDRQGDTRAKLVVVDAAGEPVEREIDIPACGATAVRLREMLPPAAQARTLSWYLISDNMELEAFWVSYDGDGGICGEHAF